MVRDLQRVRVALGDGAKNPIQALVVHHPGTYGIAADVERSRFAGGRNRQGLKRGLRDDVRAARHRCRSHRGRRDVDDRARTTGLHPAEHIPDSNQRANEIDLDRLTPVGNRKRLDWSDRRGDADIVDENVRRSPCHDFVEKALQLLFATEIDDMALDAFRRQRRDGFGVDIAPDDIVITLAKIASDDPSETTGYPCNYD